MQVRNWDKETQIKAHWILACLKTLQNLVTFCYVKNILEVMMPPSTKLQRRNNDIHLIYSMLDEAMVRLDLIQTFVGEELASLVSKFI